MINAKTSLVLCKEEVENSKENRIGFLKIIYKKSCLEQATVSRGPAAFLVLKIN
jgi:hypothetical protein